MPLTQWEQKERDGLLALETTEWRQKRAVASDPNTTGDVLARLSFDVDYAWYAGGNDDHPNLCLLAEAIVAHPNAPPETLAKLLNYNRPLGVSALCRNPIAAILGLETPDFWGRVQDTPALHLLSQEAVPRPVAAALKQAAEETVSQTARLHIALAGEIQTQSEGINALTTFLPTWSAEQSRLSRWREGKVEWHRLVTHLKFVSGSKEIAPPIVAMRLNAQKKTVFAVFSSHYHTPNSLSPEIYLDEPSWQAASQRWIQAGQSWEWVNRLNAALGLPAADDSFPSDDLHRTPRMLLEHLSRDGNRFVRWAAQTRLADPNFTFTWAGTQAGGGD